VSGIHRLLLAAALLAAGCAAAAEPAHQEPYDAGWAFYVDNDLLAPGRTDRDYTGGFSLTLAGRRAREVPWSLDGWRAGADRMLGVDRLYAGLGFSRHSLEAGVTVFTPDHLSDTARQQGERPYASLLYLANTGVQVVTESGTAYLSTLTLGVLGAPIVANAHRALHRASGSEAPQGWETQISDGGELTARYAFARVKHSWHGTLGGVAGELTTT
jgi:hypothetical protein